jgi:putative ABC transport system ATP-binding protein
MRLVEIHNLEFSYPDGEKILSIPEWSLKTEEKIFLYGPSGTGKTTFLEILAGVLVPQKGMVQFLSTDLVTLSASERDQFRAAHMGYIFQNFNLIPYLSVEENIALPCRLSRERRAHLEEKNINQEIHHLCDSLGIAELLNKNVSKLSVGQQQRVAVARALLGKPSLILADEPTSALDYDHREKFLNLLFELCAECKTGLVFVSHDRSIEHLFDRSLSLHEINRGVK